MNTLTRTIAVLVALNPLISGLALAQDASEREMQDAVATEAMEADVAGREAEIEARQAQRQAEVAKKQAEAARKQADIELAKVIESVSVQTPPVLPVTTWSANSRSRWPFQSASANSVLVIPSAEIETKDLLTINEDMNVMSRIFENNLQEARIAPAGGGLFLSSSHSSLTALLGRGSGAIQSMYLQGYGALFLMNVDFPLSAPPQTPQKDETASEEKADEVWEQMWQQMYEPQRVAKSKTGEKTEEYDPQKVEDLKMTLVKSLKHAANIRNLQPEESAILTITGGGKSASVEGIVLQKDGRTTSPNKILVRDRNSGTTRFEIIDGKSLNELGLFSPTVLVIRAKKVDIDSFANGDLDLEQFSQRVQTLRYPLLGGAIGSEDAADAVRDALMDLRYRSAR